MRKEHSLDPNIILSKEFDYAAQTAFQANEDRIRIFSYFLTTTATLIAATILPDLSNSFDIMIFICLFMTLMSFGFFSFLKLLKLRTAWVHSVIAMNTIKDFYVKQDESLAKAFSWTTGSIPKANKKFTIAYMMAITVSLVTSVCGFGTFLLIGYALTKSFYYVPGIGVMAFILLFHLLLWEALAKDRSS